jgi:hypothetical protein
LLLPIPALLIGHRDGGQNREFFDGQCDMRQIGDGAVSVLEIKCVEKFLGFLRADLFQRLLHGERGARVLGHGISLNFWFNAIDGKHFDRWRIRRFF